MPFSYADAKAFYPPRATGQFLTGSSQQAGGFADLMFPLWSPKNTGFVFADGTLVKGNDGRLILSGGVGTRAIYSSNIIGAYVFAEHAQTRLNNTYWQLNPGIEWLKANYEARLQAYIPTRRKLLYANTHASTIPYTVYQDLGTYRTPLAGAAGHAIIDTPVGLFEEAGTGVEIEGGRFFSVGKGVWARVGAYHFNYATAHAINGVEGNIEITLNQHTSLLLQNNYDNQNKNLFSIGVRFDFGGIPQIEHSLDSQMTSPIIRHIARQSYGDASPARLTYAATGPSVASQSNIWFFSPAGTQPAGLLTTLNDCTAEHPCSTIDTATAQTIGDLSPNANLYFASGNYVISPTSSTSGWVDLSTGQSLSGRNTGWLTPAVGASRPVIQGGLLWGNQSAGLIANGVINDMQIRNNGSITPNSYLQYTDNSDVAPILSEGAVLGVAATGSLMVNNSDIEVLSQQTNVSAVGITGSNSLTINNVNVNALNTANATFANNAATAIAVRAVQDVSITNSTLNAQASGSTVSNSTTDAFGIDANGAVLVSNSQVIALQSNTDLNLGFTKAVAVSSTQNALVTDSTIAATASGASGVNALTDSIGVNVSGNIVVDHSLINATQSCTLSNQIEAQAFGVLSYGTGNITIQNYTTVSAATYASSAVNGATTVFGVIAPGNIVLNDSSVNVRQLSIDMNLGSSKAFGLLNYGSGSSIMVANSQVEASASGLSGLSSADTTVYGMQSSGAIDINNSIISAIQSSQGLNQGNAEAYGVNTYGSGVAVNINASQITGKTTGNIAAGASAQAYGVVNYSGTVLANGDTILAQSAGIADPGGSVDATGILIFGNTLTFTGNQSTVTAISNSNTGTALATNVGNIVNPVTTNAQCSINNGTGAQTCS